MNQSQTQFSKYLKVLLVNISPQDSLQALNAIISRQSLPFNLSMVAYNPVLVSMFSIKSIPHYVWIGPDGRIKAITDAEALTAEHLQRLIAGLDLKLKTKI